MRKKKLTPEQQEIITTKTYFDRVVPGELRFYADNYIFGNFYKSVWAITEYPPNVINLKQLLNGRQNVWNA